MSTENTNLDIDRIEKRVRLEVTSKFEMTRVEKKVDDGFVSMDDQFKDMEKRVNEKNKDFNEIAVKIQNDISELNVKFSKLISDNSKILNKNESEIKLIKRDFKHFKWIFGAIGTFLTACSPFMIGKLLSFSSSSK